VSNFNVREFAEALRQHSADVRAGRMTRAALNEWLGRARIDGRPLSEMEQRHCATLAIIGARIDADFPSFLRRFPSHGQAARAAGEQKLRDLDNRLSERLRGMRRLAAITVAAQALEWRR